MFYRCGQRVPIEGCAQRCCNGRFVFLSDAGQRVAHELNATALHRGAHNLCGGGFQAFVVARDSQLLAPQATVGDGLQEPVSEDLGLGGSSSDSQLAGE